MSIVMKKIDLHVHSRFSNKSQNQVVSCFNANESFSEPQEIFDLAMERGMDLVTITDHDSIEGCMALKRKYPERVIMGVESTVYFPEDNHPVHILLYNFSEEQFRVINSLRHDIYEFREYVVEQRIAHSVAHPTYRLNDAMTFDHIEKLLLLFNVFEGINGCRNETCNWGFMEIVEKLDFAMIEKIARKHGIRPLGPTPWKKSFTGGSDDHAGLFIGNTFTVVEVDSLSRFTEVFIEGKIEASGNSRDYRLFSFQIYKIIYENFSRKKITKKNMLSILNDIMFYHAPVDLVTNYKIKRLKKANAFLYRHVTKVLELSAQKGLTHDEKLQLIYDSVTKFSDEAVIMLVDSIRRSIDSGVFSQIYRSLPTILAGLFVYVPFSFALKYLHKDIDFSKKLMKHFYPENNNCRKRILWFTDTINDLNGVSVTLRNIGWLSHQRGEDLSIVSSVLPEEERKDLPPNFINLEPLFHFKLPYYDKLSLKVPSFLNMMKQLHAFNADEIFISSPGVIGLYGLIFSKLLGIKCRAVYHTDFTMQAANIIKDNRMMVTIIEKYTKWFHECADKILVPTREYIEILGHRGFDRSKLGLFYRGIDAGHFEPKSQGRAFLQEKCRISGGINLIYAGRISEDKNIDFLVNVYGSLLEKRADLNLIFVGDGPYLEELKKKTAGLHGVHFTGEIPNRMLPLVYSGGDLLVFPSETDTFGMVVLEAQSCGLPAVVSNVGGPQCIVKNNNTGFVLETGDRGLWVNKLEEIISWIEARDSRYALMKRKARENVLDRYENKRVLDSLFKNEETNPGRMIS